MNCSKCRWWDSKGEQLPPHPSPEMLWVYRPCLNPSLHRDGYIESKSTESFDSTGAGMIYVNSDDVWFATGPDFGCIHFEDTEALWRFV